MMKALTLSKVYTDMARHVPKGASSLDAVLIKIFFACSLDGVSSRFDLHTAHGAQSFGRLCTSLRMCHTSGGNGL